jgi:hypothetical protein
MSDLRNISFGSLPRQAETCPEQDGPKGPASDAPLNETKVATPDYDKITPDVLSHLAKQIQENASSIGGDKSTTNASPTAAIEKSGPQAASDWLLSQGKLSLGDAGRQAMVQPGTVTTLQAAADDGPTKQNFVGGPPSPSPLGPTYGGSTGGTFDANFGNWQSSVVSGFQAGVAGYQAYQQSQQTQGGPPQSGPPAVDLLPSGGGDRPPSSQGQLGDFPALSRQQEIRTTRARSEIRALPKIRTDRPVWPTTPRATMEEEEAFRELWGPGSRASIRKPEASVAAVVA